MANSRGRGDLVVNAWPTRQHYCTFVVWVLQISYQSAIPTLAISDGKTRASESKSQTHSSSKHWLDNLVVEGMYAVQSVRTGFPTWIVFLLQIPRNLRSFKLKKEKHAFPAGEKRGPLRSTQRIFFQIRADLAEHSWSYGRLKVKVEGIHQRNSIFSQRTTKCAFGVH